ncbi:putative protein kinase RLK-Pelle-L-LEC family [Helianthus annuus]|uniref:non-specific serine/threonine protein kinase n=1 Tax=Helianthus annuus TaxID=4232 RepID=A0A251V6U4_HELAN|nr:probable L-type lectin-domain containing receptor kinase S.7 [Helianthus annuus]KAF5815108.1 putative protein kinase RLK-Pelle-L-LEC family [Helianthus annuus]KAJ0593636.1 putative protein kinase RLK-Pelle-L-LEC family [Helianthus annuus]KAJ0608645.1 putative protein kinase RLK-Pelle-L-LEC family [Helianthus annuus]
MTPSKQLVFLTLLTLNLIPHPSTAHPRTISFQFPPFPLQNLTLLGDSHLRTTAAAVTLDSHFPSSSSGTLIYTAPIRFTDNRTNSTTSFSTKFSFSILAAAPAGGGGGLSFFISPENRTLGSPGGYLGLVNSSQLTQNKFIAIEFDTRFDPHFNDPNANHVGLDIDSLNSIETADCSSVGIDLRTGVSFTSWIDYYHDRNNVQVFLTRGSGFKPENPLLNVTIDLSIYFQEIMYLGFSGSTEGSQETHSIENWSFRSFGIKRFNPRMVNPHNVSTNAVPIRSPNRWNNNRKKTFGLGFGLEVSGSVFILAGMVVFGYVSVKKWREMKTEMNIKAEVKRNPREFSYKELKTATNNFHSSQIIGHGSFGTVYKAFILSSGTPAAVKRSLRSREAKSEFLAELSAIAGLRHKNLVQLLGWCVKKGELLLVYELMPYGSIDSVLYKDPDHWGFLKWIHRYKIAIGLASVLAYLHQECDKLVIHRDIKSSNVMLDANLNARLGDFGLAKLIDHNKSPVSTLTAGTAGYLAPEYLHCGKATDKTDVYSYGVVVLEVCCGRRPIEREIGGPNMVNLVDWVWDLHTKGEVLGAIDKRLNGEFDEAEARRLLMVGLSCVNPRSDMRPSMRRVLQVLNREAEETEVPSVKPKVSFSSGMPLSVEDLMRCEEHVQALNREAEESEVPNLKPNVSFSSNISLSVEDLVRCEEHDEREEGDGSDCGFEIRID